MPDVPIADAAPAGSVPSLAAALATAALAACSDGSDGGSPAAGGAPSVPIPTKEASRFLAQAAIGPDPGSIAAVQSLGHAGWIDAQLAMPRTFSPWDWMVSKGYAAAGNVNGVQNVDAALWRSLIASPDTLRQRVALALSEILVVGIDGLNVPWRGFAAAAWFELLLDNAFGNYRTLLQLASTSPAMGTYLTFRGNRKANPATGALPDENYARELMQLFTIGLVRLEPDGIPTRIGDATVDTYGQDDVMGLARVFTGWDFDSSDTTTPDRLRRPMVQFASRHETGAKTFLGTTVPAGTDGAASLTLALDAIFAHPNVPPFVSRQLIQRLVTSNPSPAYVRRVASTFANDGRGVRGNLAATVRAILLDDEARSDAAAAGPSFGKLREPILRFTQWARAFGAASASDAWAIGNTSDPATRLGQSPLRSPSVFNFFRPGYVPPGSAVADAGLVAPELQLANESTAIGYVNWMQTVVARGAADVRPDYATWLPLASDPASLVARVADVLAAGQPSPETLAQIAAAVGSIPADDAAGRANRVACAVLLVMASPDYLVQR